MNIFYDLDLSEEERIWGDDWGTDGMDPGVMRPDKIMYVTGGPGREVTQATFRERVSARAFWSEAAVWYWRHRPKEWVELLTDDIRLRLSEWILDRSFWLARRIYPRR